MKHSTFKFAMLSLAIIALASCSKEQSSLNIEDVPGKAKIMGTLAYDAGQGFTNGAHTQLIKGAANVRVVAKVSNASIVSTSKGYTIYETQTDENGNYTIEVPADYDGGVNATIIADPFWATYSEVVEVEGDTPEIKTEEVLFKLPDSPELNVTPNDIEIHDATFTYKDRTILEAYKYTSTFVIKVGEGRWNKQKNDYDEYNAVQEYKVAAGKDVLAYIVYNEGKENEQKVCYGATTDTEGNAVFIIPSEKKAWSTKVSVEVPGYVVNNYEYYKKEWDDDKGENVVRKYSIVNGLFEQIEKEVEITFNGIEGAPAPVKKIRMKYSAFEGEETYGYSWPDKEWEDDTNS